MHCEQELKLLSIGGSFDRFNKNCASVPWIYSDDRDRFEGRSYYIFRNCNYFNDDPMVHKSIYANGFLC